MSISDELLTLKAQEVENFKASHNGNLAGFNTHWETVESERLLEAKLRVDARNDSAKKKEEEKANDPKQCGLKRSEMTIKEKVEYISEHGAEKFAELAE